jgi:hypothetical protein
MTRGSSLSLAIGIYWLVPEFQNEACSLLAVSFIVVFLVWILGRAIRYALAGS